MNESKKAETNSRQEIKKFIEKYLSNLGRVKESELKEFFAVDILRRWGPTPLQNLSRDKLSDLERRVEITDFIQKGRVVVMKWSNKIGAKKADLDFPWYILQKGGKHGWQILEISREYDPHSKSE